MKNSQKPDPRQLEVQRLLAQAGQLASTGRFDEAEAVLNGLLSQSPGEVQALVALGVIAAQAGRLEIAIERFQIALAADPANPSTLCWLSTYLLQSGQADAARHYAEEAVKLDPNSAFTHATLARCLVQAGDQAGATRLYERSIAIDPNNAAALAEYADALLACRRWPQATEALRKAVLVAPDPRQLLQLAYLELKMGKIDDAERYCRRVLRKRPDMADAYVVMAGILTEQLKLDEAEQVWQQAELLHSGPGSLHVERAVSLSAIGHFDEAILELERSIEAKPLQGEAYQALVFAKRVLPADRPLVDQMERLLSDSSLSESDRLNLMYSLGKAYDNLGEFERAIGFFDAANALKLKLEHVAPLDRKAFSALIDAKIEIFKKGETLVGKRFQSESSLPILVAGMMRSGTTLAEQMLSCHPMVGGAGEQSYWGENEASIIDYWGRTISTAALQICSREYGSLLAAISPGFPFVIDKNPANVQHIGSFHMAFPNAKTIVTRRDAVDTALSIWMTPLNTMAEFVCDRENIVFAYKECMRLMDHWREVLPADRYLEIRYEDLVANPEEHARKMVEFCGLEWDEKCLHPERNERRIRTPSMWQVRQPIYKSSTERWRKYEPWLGAFEQLRGLA